MTSKEALNKLAMLARRGNYTDKELNTILHDFTYIVLKDLERLEQLEKLEKAIVSKKRIQSLRETANPIYEVVLHIPQNLLKEVLVNDK